MSTEINLPFISAHATGPKHLSQTITRATLEELINPVVERCKVPVQNALKDAHLTQERSTTSYWSAVRPACRSSSDSSRRGGPKIQRGVDPMECVAIGAAIQAGVLPARSRTSIARCNAAIVREETLGGVHAADRAQHTIPTARARYSAPPPIDRQGGDPVLQGERHMTANKHRRPVPPPGIPPAPAGCPRSR